MSWFNRLFSRKPKPLKAEIVEAPTMACMRQEDTWCWPAHLGEKTAGVCEKCKAPIFYEKQNELFRKICHICAGY